MKTMEQFTIYCTPEQTKRAYKLGAPIEASEDYSNGNVGSKLCLFGEIANKDRWGVGKCVVLRIPTAEQMQEWLCEKEIWFEVYDSGIWCFSICGEEGVGTFIKHKEAILAAIDAALDYLEGKRL